MALSLFVRAVSWFSIIRAALPNRPLRRRDVTSATMLGVLMSATLPARLGEPARAMVLARRMGRMRQTFPVILGTLVSQTVFNLIALVGLGVIIVSTTDLFHSRSEQIFLFSLAPLALLLAVLCAPLLVRRQGNGRIARLAIGDSRRRRPGPPRAAHLPRAAPRGHRRRRPARRLGDPARRLLGAPLRPRPRGRSRHRRRRRGPLRRQRHGRGAGDALQHRRLPARRDQRPPHRLRRLHRGRPRLRRDPAGGRDRDRRRPRRARRWSARG